mgnify:FL=1|jgi:hypothetical protein
MDAITIKLHFPSGDPKRLRTGQITNWNGLAVAAPRSEFGLFLNRDELKQTGVYLLLGTDESTGEMSAYIGEAEVLRDRLKSHKDKDYWVQAFAFVSAGDTLTKGHIRYLEGRLIELANVAGRAKLKNAQGSGSRLPESDKADMEVFLGRIQQLLPPLGTDLLVPVLRSSDHRGFVEAEELDLQCRIKDLVATGRRTPNGFVVYKGSHASLTERPSAAQRHPYVLVLRNRLLSEGKLREESGRLVFTADVEFSSPSAAASVVHGGGANGLTAWKRDW